MNGPGLFVHVVHQHIAPERARRGEVGLAVADLGDLADEADEIRIAREHERVDQDTPLAARRDLGEGLGHDEGIEAERVAIDAAVGARQRRRLAVRDHDNLPHVLLLALENAPGEPEAFAGVRVVGADLRAGELAERLKCDLNRKFKTLSSGNRQKIGLIAALMHDPELLIFDEPTSGLDPITQAEFNKIVLEHKAAGKTAFISSHMLSEVQEICDSVAFIRAGQLASVKSMTELTRGKSKLLRVSGGKELMDTLKKLKSLSVSDQQDGVLEGIYDGDVNELLAVIAKHKVGDFSLNDSNLETAFMRYYQEDKNA